MRFGEAIEAMKNSQGVTRKGWNGKGMRLYIAVFEHYAPCVVMVTATGVHQPGWLASQADMLAEDWELV